MKGPIRWARLLFAAICAFGLLNAPTLVDAHPHISWGESDKHADGDTERTMKPVRFRSVGLGASPHPRIEADIYVHPGWAAGVGVGRSGGDGDDDCFLERCWVFRGGDAYVEHLFFVGDRWAHFGLRAGAFGGKFYSHTFAFGRDGHEISRDGALFGLSLGATLNVTAFRWGAATLTLTGLPGVFTGVEKDGWPNRSWPDQPPLQTSSATNFVFSGAVSFGFRFGNLDARGVGSGSSNDGHTHLEAH